MRLRLLAAGVAVSSVLVGLAGPAAAAGNPVVLTVARTGDGAGLTQAVLTPGTGQSWTFLAP